MSYRDDEDVLGKLEDDELAEDAELTDIDEDFEAGLGLEEEESF